MTDAEKVIVVGSLDDDIDEESLPEESRHLAKELYELFVNGFPLIDRGEQNGIEGVTLPSYLFDSRTGERFSVPYTVFGLDTWLGYAIDAVYNKRVVRTVLNLVVVPVVRQANGTIVRTKLHEQISTIEVCPHTIEREQTRVVLEILLERWKSDFHLRGLNTNTIYRELTKQIDASNDTWEIARIKKEAWSHKEQGRLSIKLFTSLMTRANVRQSALENEPLKETRAGENGARKFVVIQPLLNRIPKLMGGTLCDFALQLHCLPRQEKERVRASFQSLNPQLYSRVLDGLLTELEKATPKRLSYFLWAFYPGNKPEHPVHTLRSEDQSAAWELLKEFSRLKEKETDTPPLLSIAENAKHQSAAATA
jgi:hypothetical protein